MWWVSWQAMLRGQHINNRQALMQLIMIMETHRFYANEIRVSVLVNLQEIKPAKQYGIPRNYRNETHSNRGDWAAAADSPDKSEMWGLEFLLGFKQLLSPAVRHKWQLLLVALHAAIRSEWLWCLGAPSRKKYRKNREKHNSVLVRTTKT